MSQPAESDRPARAKAVLTALILVAAVANLNLAVANVALPDIGKAFDAGQAAQPDRGRLLARARRLGALPRRARRPLRTEDDAAARHRAGDTGLRARRPCAVDRGPVRRPSRSAASPPDGIPDDPGADHRALVGTGADQIDRPLVCAGRGHRRPRAADRRRPADAVRLGLGLLITLPLAVVALYLAGASSPPTSTSRPSRSTTSAASSRC